MKFQHCGACGMEKECYRKQECQLSKNKEADTPWIEHPDWMALRARFFAECVENNGANRKISYAPHDLFEWFKAQLTKKGKG